MRDHDDVMAEVIWAMGMPFNRYLDLMRQAMLNNLWDYNPGELNRWENEGGMTLED